MAELTDRLPLTEGTNKVYDIPAAPSAVGAAADFARSALTGYMQIRQDEAERKRNEAAEARRKEAESASYAAVKGYGEAVDLTNRSAQTAANQQAALSPLEQLSAPAIDIPTANVESGAQGVFTVPAVSTPEAVTKDATKAAREIGNVIAAVDQGKMPSISLKAALNGKFNQLIDQHPTQAENILDIWKKMGIDTTLFREGKDLGDQLDEDRESAQRGAEDNRKLMQHMYEVGVESLGETIATGGSNGGAMTREEVIAHGLVVSRQAHDLELQTQAANLQLQRANLSKADAEQIEKDKNQVIFKTLNTALYNGSTPIVNMVQNLSNSILKEPNPTRQAEKWQAVGARLHAMFANSTEQAVQQAVAGGYTGNVDQLRSSLTAQFKRVEDLFTGPYSVAQAHLQALQTIQTKLKIDGAQALPVYTALHDLGIDPNTMTAFVNGLSENTALSNSLRDEIKGFSTDFGQDRASTHMMNIVHMLRGESTLASMTPSEARQKLPDLYHTTQSLVTSYVRGLGGDPEMVMNGIGELSIAANSLTPSSGANAHQVAAGGVLNKDQVTALKRLTTEKGLDPSMVTATIQASRAAGAHILNNFQANIAGLNKIDSDYQIRWNRASGQYVVDDSAARKKISMNRTLPSAFSVAGAQGAYTGASQIPVNPRMPNEMERWVKAANMSLDGLIATRDNDPSTPKGTDLELRNYYGRNIPPKSIQSSPGHNTNPDAEIEKQFNVIEDVLDKSLTSANQPISTGTVHGIDTTKSFRENVPAIMQAEGTAQAKGWDTILGDAADGTNAYGVTPPKPVSQMTLGEAFKFGNGILRPASGELNSSAMGGLQITATNIRDFGKQLFGADWQSKPFNQENQIKLAEAIHAAQGYGAWEGLKR